MLAYCPDLLGPGRGHAQSSGGPQSRIGQRQCLAACTDLGTWTWRVKSHVVLDTVLVAVLGTRTLNHSTFGVSHCDCRLQPASLDTMRSTNVGQRL